MTKLEPIFHFRVGAYSLPIEQGRIEKPQHLRRCTFCATNIDINAIGDERHCIFDCLDCPHFQGLRQQHAETFHTLKTWLSWTGLQHVLRGLRPVLAA